MCKKNLKTAIITSGEKKGQFLSSENLVITPKVKNESKHKVNKKNSYHLVRGVVRLELLVSRVLHVNWVVSDDGGDRGVVAHHRLRTLLTVQFQEGLQGEDQRGLVHLWHRTEYANRKLFNPCSFIKQFLMNAITIMNIFI